MASNPICIKSEVVPAVIAFLVLIAASDGLSFKLSVKY